MVLFNQFVVGGRPAMTFNGHLVEKQSKLLAGLPTIFWRWCVDAVLGLVVNVNVRNRLKWKIWVPLLPYNFPFDFFYNKLNSGLIDVRFGDYMALGVWVWPLQSHSSSSCWLFYNIWPAYRICGIKAACHARLSAAAWLAGSVVAPIPSRLSRLARHNADCI